MRKLSAKLAYKYFNADQKRDRVLPSQDIFWPVSVGSDGISEPSWNYGWNFDPYIWSRDQRTIHGMERQSFPASKEVQDIFFNPVACFLYKAKDLWASPPFYINLPFINSYTTPSTKSSQSATLLSSSAPGLMSSQAGAYFTTRVGVTTQRRTTGGCSARKRPSAMTSDGSVSINC
jgi:hypothetical protein